ncbi:MAG: carboxypeptidase Q [Sphingobacteriales bacterium]|jgi:carboxypeptidase Q
MLNSFSVKISKVLLASAIGLMVFQSCNNIPKVVTKKVTLDSVEKKMVSSIFDEVLLHGEAYDKLGELCLNIGNRLSGSVQAQKAVEWSKKVMEDYGFDSVYLQPVMVPHWERGPAESAKIVGDAKPLTVLAIGGSEPTPKTGITAEVIQVFSLDEVRDLSAEAVKGKIVFFNRPFDQTVIGTGAGYSGAVDQRVYGPSVAAEKGAVAVVIRSIASAFDDTPHTGTLVYDDAQPRIPAGALGVKSAMRLAKALEKNPNTKVSLTINSQWFEDAPSFNVIGEIWGSENKNNILTVGGHLDSWDVGHGAHDDGSGCVQSIEVLRALKVIGYKPKNTMRAVMFMNEENGGKGGLEYNRVAMEKGENHLFALESDAGGFSPRGFGATAAEEQIEKFQAYLPLFDPNTIAFIRAGGGGADIHYLYDSMKVPVMGLNTDNQKYFDYHHTSLDTYDKVNRRELHLGAASMAAMMYLVDKNGN